MERHGLEQYRRHRRATYLTPHLQNLQLGMTSRDSGYELKAESVLITVIGIFH
jgi:hypothetical protein